MNIGLRNAWKRLNMEKGDGSEEAEHVNHDKSFDCVLRATGKKRQA